MNLRKNLNERSNLQAIDNKSLFLIMASLGLGLFVLITYFLKFISNSQKIFIDPIPNNLQHLPSQAISVQTDSGEYVLNVKVANTQETRTQGLMNIASMPENEGMIFIFPDNATRNFWMKNTLISLDIIFLNEEFEVINIASNTTPLREDIYYRSNTPSKYVLEINAGLSEKYSISTGSKFFVN